MGQDLVLQGWLAFLRSPPAIWLGLDAFALVVIFGRDGRLREPLALDAWATNPWVIGGSVLILFVATPMLVVTGWTQLRRLAAAERAWRTERDRDRARARIEQQYAEGLSRTTPAQRYLMAECLMHRAFPRVDGDPERMEAALGLQELGLGRITNGRGIMPHQRFLEFEPALLELAQRTIPLPHV